MMFYYLNYVCSYYSTNRTTIELVRLSEDKQYYSSKVHLKGDEEFFIKNSKQIVA